MTAVPQFGKVWQMRFAPNKTFSLLISLKHDLLPNPHPPLAMATPPLAIEDAISLLNEILLKFYDLNLLTW